MFPHLLHFVNLSKTFADELKLICCHTITYRKFGICAFVPARPAELNKLPDFILKKGRIHGKANPTMAPQFSFAIDFGKTSSKGEKIFSPIIFPISVITLLRK